MIDTHFFSYNGPYPLAALASIGACVWENTGKDFVIHHVRSLEDAQPGDLSFLHQPQKYLPFLKTTKASAVILEDKYKKELPEGVHALVSKEPYRAFAKIAAAFYGEKEQAYPTSVHPTAVVASSASIGDSCFLGPFVIVEDGVEIGAGTRIEGHVALKTGVRIGKRCFIGFNSSLGHCFLGDDVHLDPGVRIGQPGFGFHIDYQAGHTPVPQLGGVIIGDRVTVGANTTIDRGSLRDTVIGSGTMIDNLVQIGHNVHIGKNCVIVAQVGIAGSTHIGDAVTIAGQAGLAGHLSVGSGAVIAAQSGVMRDVPAKAVVAGSPSVSSDQWKRQAILLQKMVQNRKGS